MNQYTFDYTHTHTHTTAPGAGRSALFALRAICSRSSPLLLLRFALCLACAFLRSPIRFVHVVPCLRFHNKCTDLSIVLSNFCRMLETNTIVPIRCLTCARCGLTGVFLFLFVACGRQGWVASSHEYARHHVAQHTLLMVGRTPMFV